MIGTSWPLLSRLCDSLLNLLAGPALPKPENPTNPLQYANAEPGEWTAIEKSKILQRAQYLVSCNLQDYESHFMLATALVTTSRGWKDPKLREPVEHQHSDNHYHDQNEEQAGTSHAEEAGSPSRHSSGGKNPLSRASRVNDSTPPNIHDGATTLPHRAMTDDEYESFKEDEGSVFRRLFVRQSGAMWRLMLLCGIGAMTQGWDEAAVNGAQVYYQSAYGFQANDARIGLLNGIPYACCFVSCWLSWPLNQRIGRRGAIMVAAFLSFAFALAQSFANDWKVMLALRIGLGFGIGPKSATIPIYAAEVAPAEIRGALVMLWQLFTALGIMFGYLSGIAFATTGAGNAALFRESPCSAEDSLLSLACSLNWRLMIGSPMAAPILLCLYMYYQPESPRWLIARAQRLDRTNRRKAQYKLSNKEQKDKDNQLDLTPDVIDLEPVYLSLYHLRGGSKLKAARDMLIIDVLLWTQKNAEQSSSTSVNQHEKSNQDEMLWQKLRRRSPGAKIIKWIQRATTDLKDLFGKDRNRNALAASTVVMFLQQFCGINVLIYYSTLVLFQTDDVGRPTLWGNVPRFIVLSSIIGIVNFIFGLPALFVIDQHGRRPLLLRTILVLGGFAVVVAVGHLSAFDNHSTVRVVLLCIGMFGFVIFYSPGMGPVPFVYAAESFPQDTRDLVTSLNWVLNFTVAVSFPSMARSRMGLFGTFLFYALWCCVGFFLVLFLVPETCQQELELLDKVFTRPINETVKKHYEDFINSWTSKSFFGRQHNPHFSLRIPRHHRSKPNGGSTARRADSEGETGDPSLRMRYLQKSSSDNRSFTTPESLDV